RKKLKLSQKMMNKRLILNPCTLRTQNWSKRRKSISRVICAYERILKIIGGVPGKNFSRPRRMEKRS
ncbi:MAG TPA: hypothetical protein DDZ91_02380, partial [Firmicutes bacterium]|nr:hypothetical protein [Bacillota bacterium]